MRRKDRHDSPMTQFCMTPKTARSGTRRVTTTTLVRNQPVVMGGAYRPSSVVVIRSELRATRVAAVEWPIGGTAAGCRVRIDELGELQYITPIANLASIMEQGILSHKRAAAL